jgi:hypothetical protein
MADPSAKPPVETIPSVYGGISAIGSAHAPIVYFENASVYSVSSGIVKVTLEAERLLPGGEGTVLVDRVVVAHLRMNILGAKGLRDALDKMILAAMPTESPAKN